MSIFCDDDGDAYGGVCDAYDDVCGVYDDACDDGDDDDDHTLQKMMKKPKRFGIPIPKPT